MPFLRSLTLNDATSSLVVVPRFELVGATAEVRGRALDRETARWALEAALSGAFGAQVVGRIHRELLDGPRGPVDLSRVDRLRRDVLAALDDGRLVVLRSERGRVIHVIDEEQEQAPLGPAEHDGWIEIELVDDDGNPVANEPYRIELPDGSVRESTLNAVGKSREEGFQPGTCKVSFPRLDPPSWSKVA